MTDQQLIDSLDEAFRLTSRWLKYIFKKYDAKGNQDITPNQYRVLWVLKKQGPIKMKELGSKVHTSCGSLTIMIDRLIEKKLVERLYLPEDRRIVMVKITPFGEEILREYREGYLRVVLKDLEKLTQDEKEELLIGVDTINRLIKKIKSS